MKYSFFILFLAIFCNFSVVSAQNETHQKEEISSLIAKKRAYNKKTGFGFRIQLYNGNETKAVEIKETFEELYPEIFIKLKYNNPYWNVQIGNYKTQLEADRAKLLYSKKFRGVIVIPMSK